jgi:hypothetical protein
VFYGRSEKKTSFDREQIEDLRADFQELSWNLPASQQAGDEAIFMEI